MSNRRWERWAGDRTGEMGNGFSDAAAKVEEEGGRWTARVSTGGWEELQRLGELSFNVVGKVVVGAKRKL